VFCFIDLSELAKQRNGDSKKENLIIGRFNNVVFAGAEAIKSAARLG